MHPSFQCQRNGSFQDRPAMSQERRPSSFETAKSSSSLLSPPASPLILVPPPHDAAATIDITLLRQAQNVNLLPPSFAKMSEEFITSSFIPPASSRGVAVMEDAPLRSHKFEHRIPIIYEMPSAPHYDATEKDFDDGLKEFFHDRVNPINPPHQCDDSSAFVACSPFDPQHKSRSIKNYMTCLTGTLLQHMDTSEISRRKVAKIRLLLRHKLMQNHYQHAKELVAGTSPKSERTRQTLLNSLTVYQRNSMSTTPNGSGCSISYADIKHARGKVDNGHPVLQTSPPRVSLLDNSYVTVSSSADLESYQMLPRASMDNSRATPAVSSSADLESYQMHPRASIVSMDNRRATAVSSSADLESYQMQFFPED